MSQSHHSNNPIKFAYWVPNVSGGLLVSKIEQRTSWDIDYNRKLAQIAEKAGYASHEEFIVHIIEKELAQFEGAESDAAITEKLKGLGYIS